MVDNNSVKWLEMNKFYKENNSINAKLPEKMTKGELAAKGEGAKDPNAIYHDAKYTIQDAGKKVFGTFTEEGLVFFSKLAKEIKTHRKKNLDDIKKYEEAYRISLRKRNNVDNPAQNNRRRAGNGGGDGAAKKPKIQLNFDSDDEE